MSNKEIIVELLKSLSTITSVFGIIDNEELQSLTKNYSIVNGKIEKDTKYLYHFDNGFHVGCDTSFIKKNADIVLKCKKVDYNNHHTMCYLMKINS